MDNKYKEDRKRRDATSRRYGGTGTDDEDKPPLTEKYSHTSTISNLTGELRGYSSSGSELGEICWLPAKKPHHPRKKSSPLKKLLCIFKPKRKKTVSKERYMDQNDLGPASASDHTLESVEGPIATDGIEQVDSRELIDGKTATCSSLSEKCGLPPNSPRGDEISTEIKTSKVNQQVNATPSSPDAKSSDHVLECCQGLVVLSDIPRSESTKADSPSVTLVAKTRSLCNAVVSSPDTKPCDQMLDCCGGLVVVSDIPNPEPSVANSTSVPLVTTTHSLPTTMSPSSLKKPSVACFPLISPPEDFQASRTTVSVAPCRRELPCPSQKPPEAGKSEWKRHFLRVELTYDGRSLDADEKKWLEKQITGLVNVLLERGKIPKNLSISELTKKNEPSVSAGAQSHSDFNTSILDAATNVPGVSSFEPRARSRTMKLGGIIPMLDGDDDVDDDAMLLRMGLREARVKYRGVIDELDSRLCGEFINTALTGASSVNTFVTAREDSTDKELRTQSGTDCTLVPSDEAIGPFIQVKIFEDETDELNGEDCSHFMSRSEPHIPIDKELQSEPGVERTSRNMPIQNQLASESASSPHMFRISERPRSSNLQHDVADDPIIKCLIEESTRQVAASHQYPTGSSSSQSTSNTIVPQTPKPSPKVTSNNGDVHYSTPKTASGTAFKTVVRSTPQDLFKSTAPINTQVSDFRTVKKPFALRVDDSLKIKIPIPSPRKVEITSSGTASIKAVPDEREQAPFAPISLREDEDHRDKNAAEMELSRRLGTTDVAAYTKAEKDVKKCSPGLSPSDVPVGGNPRHKKHTSKQKEGKSKRGHHPEKKSRLKGDKERNNHERYSPPKSPARRSPQRGRSSLRPRSPYVMHESLDDSGTSVSESADSQTAVESDTAASEGDRREYDTSPEPKSRHRRHTNERPSRRRSHTPPVRDIKPSHSSSPSSRRTKRASAEFAFKTYSRTGKKTSRVTFDDTPSTSRSGRRRSTSRQSSPFLEKSPPRSSQSFGPMQFWGHGTNAIQSTYGTQFLPPRMNLPDTQFQAVSSKMHGAPPVYFPFPMQMTPFTNFTQYALSPMQTQGQAMLVSGDKTEASVQTKSAASSVRISTTTPTKAIQNPTKEDITSRGDEPKVCVPNSPTSKSDTSKTKDSPKHSAVSASNNSLKSSGSGHRSRRWRQCEREKEEGEAWWMPKDWAKERGIGSYGKTWEFEKEQFEKKEKELQIAKDANIEQIRMSRFVSL